MTTEPMTASMMTMTITKDAPVGSSQSSHSSSIPAALGIDTVTMFPTRGRNSIARDVDVCDVCVFERMSYVAELLKCVS